MNDVADENGKVEPRIKLIRRTSIGSYSFDNKPSGTGSSTSVLGSNDWSDSALKEVLNNGAYYNRTSGECPSGRNGATIACDFSSTGLINEAKGMISKIKWKLGGTSLSTNTSTVYNASVMHFYSYERGTKVYSGRPTEWIGEVGLVYPSDFGYATVGGDTKTRSQCLSSNLFLWHQLNDCYSSDWLRSDEWTIMSDSASSTQILFLYAGRIYDLYQVDHKTNVRPVVYLNTNIKVISGTGSSTDPYVLVK